MPDELDNATAQADNGDAQDTSFRANTDTDEGAQTQTADWLQSLEEPYRKDPSAMKFKSPNDLFKSYKNLEKLVGADKVVKPGKNATPEQWNEFYKALGRPDSPEGYKFEMPEELRNESREKLFAGKAHELGLLPHQVEGLSQWWAEEMNQEMSRMGESQQEMAKQAETVLRKEWGMAYNQNLQLATKALKAFGDEDAVKALESVGNNPAVLKLFANIGKKLAEDGMIGRPAGDMLSPEEAEAKIRELQSHPGYMDGGHPEHKIIVKKLEGLFAMKYANS
jgi:hypothetical protein